MSCEVLAMHLSQKRSSEDTLIFERDYILMRHGTCVRSISYISGLITTKGIVTWEGSCK